MRVLSADRVALVKFRRGRASDAKVIANRVWSEKMNPLGLLPQRFIIAENENSDLIGFGQIKPLGEAEQELATLIVDREYRGRGIGKEIVKQLLESAEDPSTVYLTTLGNTTPFYTGIGFKECSKVPPNLWFECILGTIVARMVANDRLVVMKYDVT